MTPLFHCPNASCGKALRVPEELLGRKLKCPHCAETFVVPRPDGAAESWMPAAAAAGTKTEGEKQSFQRRLAVYDLVDGIAEGGMGAVLCCEDGGIGRQVAVKVMKFGREASQEQRVRFIEEAQITGQLEHPNIVPVHEQGADEDGNPYFTMKLVHGESLGQILKSMGEGEPGPSLSELLQMFLKVCDAVAFAHSRGVIHRDLKPDNIMVGEYGEVLVMDWGLAKVIGPDRGLGEAGEPARAPGDTDQEPLDQPAPGPAPGVSTLRSEYDGVGTLEGAIAGTPAYMSPEQAAGKVKELDARTDIYALGAILYQVLTLEPPVRGETLNEVLQKVMEGKLVPPQERSPDLVIPRDLSAVAMKAMARQSQDRYASARDLSRDVLAFLEGRSVTAKEDTFFESLVKLAKRNKPVSVAVSVALLILITMASLFVTDNAQRTRMAQAALGDTSRAQQEQVEALRVASEELAQQAIRSAEEQRWEEAKFLADTAVKVSPGGLWGYYAWGNVSREQGDLAEAEKWLRQALGTDASHKPSLASLAQVLALQHRTEEVAILSEQLGDARDWRSLAATADAWFELGRYREAETVYRAAEVQMKADPYTLPRSFSLMQERLQQIRPWTLCEGFHESIQRLEPQDKIRPILEKLKEIHGYDVPFRPVIFGGRIKDIDVSGTAIRHLQPFQGFELETLFCNRTRVSDLRPLRAMTVENLELKENPDLVDLSPLQWMRLKRLDTYNSPVRDANPLRGMPLVSLCLNGARLRDLSPLRGMPLESLAINSMPISDLSPLQGMSLRHLDVSFTEVKDLSVLKGMPLESLACRIQSLSDLSVLRGLPLRSLSCGNSQVRDLGPLRGMMLQALLADWCSVTDLSPLQGMAIENLNLGGTPVSDLAPLRGMPLNTLSISQSAVSDLGPLQGMPLRFLYCENTRVRDLNPLRGLSLEELSLVGCPVSDLTPLRDTSLRGLNCSGSGVKSLEGLRGSSISDLNIAGCNVTDLGPLKDLKLIRLNCGWTPVSDVRPLSALFLNSLALHHTKVTDLTPLAGLKLEEFRPPDKKRLTPESLQLVEKLILQGCRVYWE